LATLMMVAIIKMKIRWKQQTVNCS
jgi:hypothetical protein